MTALLWKQLHDCLKEILHNDQANVELHYATLEELAAASTLCQSMFLPLCQELAFSSPLLSHVLITMTTCPDTTNSLTIWTSSGRQLNMWLVRLRQAVVCLGQTDAQSQLWSEQVLSTKVALGASATMAQELESMLSATLTACFVPATADSDDEDDDDQSMVDQAEATMAAAQAEQLPAMLTMWRSLPSAIVRDYGVRALHKSLDSCLHQSVLAAAQDDFEVQVLPALLARTEQLYNATVLKMLPTDLVRSVNQLHHHVYHELGLRRIAQLFDIVVEWPDSQPCLLDLQACLQHTDLRPRLVEDFKAALSKRLLHPGAQTADIISQYVSTVHVLNLLDPSGVIRERVCGPVRTYLQTRRDTVKAVVEAVVSEQHGAGQPTVAELEDYSDSWLPELNDIDAVDDSATALKSTDPLQLLIGIYGSNEVFVDEFRGLLGQRLLQQDNYSTTSEIRTLELLKLRFGEDALHRCEVMVKDFKESRRIHNSFANAHTTEMEAAPINHNAVNVFVLSRLYWPNVKADSFKLPEAVNSFMDTYTKSYSELKAGRTLELRPSAGTVQLTLELAGREETVTVPPLTASIIVLFQDQPNWTLEELSTKLEASSSAVRHRLAYWLSMGIVREESSGCFVLDEEGQATGQHHHEAEMESEEASQENTVLLKFVEGMLTNFKQLPFERIAAMLNMFMTGDQAYKGTPADLRKLLDKFAKEGLLGRSGDFYTLP
eukprot:m.106333 g.106333  ORF g.106333 m.106333 type:complete len:719 (+) comp15301_c0_seq1:82-2238(+)